MKRLFCAVLTLVLVMGLFPAVALTPASAAEKLDAPVWNQGTHYGTPNTGITSRKYTVIPCHEGEIYHLDFPSDNWAIYVHFADAEGDFGVEYLYRTGKPLDVVVREMNGRVPTELRLTTFYRPNTSAVITDELWATFDVTIHKSTVVKGDLLHNAQWNQGTPVNPSTALRKHTRIPCQVGDVFRFGFVSTYWDVYVLPADDNGPLTDEDTYFSKDGTFTVAPVDGKDPTGILVVAVPDPQGTSITDVIWSSFCVSCVKEGSTFTFATQNYGLWNDGVTQGVAADKVDARAEAWQAKMAEHDIDILVGQEWQPYLDSDKTVDANNKVFGSMYPYMYGSNTSTYDGKNIISRTPLTDITYAAMVSNVGRRYAKAYTMIDGKKVCIIDAHLSFEEDINLNRKEEIVQLLNIAQTEPYVIIAGDFNVFTPDEFRIFEEAGYSLANAGAFGEFNTWPNLGRNPNAVVNRVLDNIIVGPGIKINSVQVDDHRLSDHAMLVAELELLDAFTDNRLLCEHCNQFVQWTPCTLTNGGMSTSFRENGHYYLSQDLPKVNSQFWIGVLNEATPDVVLDLRGHAVTSSARAFYVRKNSKLSIVDTIGCGTVRGGSSATGGLAYIEGGSTLSLYDGSLIATNTTTAKKGGAIFAETGTFVNVYGGEIYGGYATHGGAIYASSQNIVNITDGTIYGSQATSAGGAIYIHNGTLNMTGGTVTGGVGGSGGGLYLSQTEAKLTGGAVTGSSGTYGGNIHVTGNATLGGLTLGNCDISGGSASGAGSDIYLSGTGKLKVLSTFAGSSAVAVNTAHLPDTAPGSALNPALDSCEGPFSGQLILESLSGKPELCGLAGDTGLYIASAALVTEDGSRQWHANNDSAVAAYTESTAYLLPAAGGLTLAGGCYTVDLAGKNVNITGTGSVSCFDSANDTYETFGTATIEGVTLTNDSFIRREGKLYFTLLEDGVYSFHRMDMQLESVALRPADAGMYYTGSWRCDDTLAAHIDSFGVAVSLKDVPGDDFAESGNALWTSFTGSEFESGVTKSGAMVSGILKDAESGVSADRIAQNSSFVQMNVLANTYVTVDGVTCAGIGAGVSLYDILKTVSDHMDQYSDSAAALQAFMTHWRSNGLTGEPWDSLNFA